MFSLKGGKPYRTLHIVKSAAHRLVSKYRPASSSFTIPVIKRCTPTVIAKAKTQATAVLVAEYWTWTVPITTISADRIKLVLMLKAPE
jgi:hypothetical protein